MNHKGTLTSCLALAATVGAGLAAAPFAVDSDLQPRPTAAFAQESGSDDSGGTGDSGAGTQDDGTAGGDTNDSDSGTGDATESGADTESDAGLAEEQATATTGAIPDETADSVYDILGTTREEAEDADMQTSASAQYGPLEGYQTEVERGNLDAAAGSLAAIAKEPITEEMVTEVNTELGVETRLSAQQIAEAAARKQDSAD